MRPVAVSRLERVSRALVRGGRRVPGVRAFLLNPVVALLGYWLATLGALLWAVPLSLGRVRRRGRLIVAEQMPRFAFGRGGTTIGGVFLTHGSPSTAVLEHETVHRDQWRRYGLAFAVLYAAAGRDPFTNRFEIEAGLAKGNYRRPWIV
jgi:hypothetical protein